MVVGVVVVEAVVVVKVVEVVEVVVAAAIFSGSVVLLEICVEPNQLLRDGRFPITMAITAFWACNRFSACSKYKE